MTDNRATELLLCPFCGGEAETHEVTFPHHYWYVLCDGECFGNFCERPTEAEAVAAWNTRAEFDGIPMTEENMAAHGWAKVVRCRDCRYAIDLCDGTIDCTGPLTTGWDYYNDEPQQNIVEPDGFCAWGERKID